LLVEHVLRLTLLEKINVLNHMILLSPDSNGGCRRLTCKESIKAPLQKYFQKRCIGADNRSEIIFKRITTYQAALAYFHEITIMNELLSPIGSQSLGYPFNVFLGLCQSPNFYTITNIL